MKSPAAAQGPDTRLAAVVLTLLFAPALLAQVTTQTIYCPPGERATGATAVHMVTARAAGLPPPTYPHGIRDVDVFLEQCPTLDPAFAQIWSDFKIRRNGSLVSVPACHEPISTIPTAEYTDELIVLQGLRTIYYMDRGQSNHLPWTVGKTLYDWMKSRIAGIDIRDDTGFSFCCEDFGGLYIGVRSQDDFNRDFDRRWRGIAGNIDLYAHETRHVDGFPHTSCCGTPGGCDQTFDESNLTPYGVQWWLNALWLNGGINVGFACSAESGDDEAWFETSCSSFKTRFCTSPPPDQPRPAQPGGTCVVPSTAPCIGSSSTLCLQGGRFKVEATWLTSDGRSGVGRAAPLTSDTGYFWFFSASNVEMIVKVLDGCALNAKKWVFAGGLTNVEVTLTVTDTQTGSVQTYVKPSGTAFQPIQDTAAFATCP